MPRCLEGLQLPMYDGQSTHPPRSSFRWRRLAALPSAFRQPQLFTFSNNFYAASGIYLMNLAVFHPTGAYLTRCVRYLSCRKDTRQCSQSWRLATELVVGLALFDSHFMPDFSVSHGCLRRVEFYRFSTGPQTSNSLRCRYRPRSQPSHHCIQARTRRLCRVYPPGTLDGFQLLIATTDYRICDEHVPRRLGEHRRKVRIMQTRMYLLTINGVG